MAVREGLRRHDRLRAAAECKISAILGAVVLSENDVSTVSLAADPSAEVTATTGRLTAMNWTSL
jgi:plasmid stability protein